MAIPTDPTARLAALQAARDALISGTAIAEVEYNGEKRVFAKADLQRLDREITLAAGNYGTVRVRM